MRKVPRLCKVSFIFLNIMKYFWQWNVLKVVCKYPLEPGCPKGKIYHLGRVPRLPESSIIFFKHNEIFFMIKISRKLHIGISLRPIVLGRNITRNRFRRVPRLSKVSCIFCKHNEIFLTMKCFESCMYASTWAQLS